MPVRDTGWRAYPQGTAMGEKALGSLGPRGGRRGWDHCFRAKPSRGHEELTLRQVLRNETGTVKLRRVWV